MKIHTVAGLVLMMSGAVLQAQQTVNMDPVDGKLTATIPAGAVYSIQWIGALDSANGWQQSWGQMRGQKSEDGNVEVDIPMAFRLTSWTNGVLVNAPVGRTYYYTRTNQVGDVWTNEVRVLGDTYMPHLTNSYRTIWSEDWYDLPYEVPVGAQPRGAQFMRADENGAYFLDSGLLPGPLHENLVWTDAPVSTTWSYFDSTPHTTITNTIMAVEDVTIGAATYENCIKIRSVGADQPWYLGNYPRREYTVWIEPGGYVVKSENWWIHQDYTSAAPIVYELQSWTDL